MTMKPITARQRYLHIYYQNIILKWHYLGSLILQQIYEYLDADYLYYCGPWIRVDENIVLFL